MSDPAGGVPVSTDISGASYPLVIDQADIMAPDFPRSAEWWRRFMPSWISVEVRNDGTVALDYDPAGLLACSPRGRAAALQRGRAGMVRWVNQALAQHLRPTSP